MLTVPKYKDHEIVEQRTFERIKSEKRLILDTYNTFQYWLLPVLLGLIFPVWAAFSTLLPYAKLVVVLVLPVFAVVIWRRQKEDLKFKRFEIHCTANRFKNAAKRAGDKLCWEIDYCDDRLIRAYFMVPLLESPVMITILRDKGELLINCVGYPFGPWSARRSTSIMCIEDFLKLLK